MPVVVGAGGASVTALAGSSIVGNVGGKSSFGSSSTGFLMEAYGGGCSANFSSGGGIYSSSSGSGPGFGGLPCTTPALYSGANYLNADCFNATHEFGGASAGGIGGAFYIGKAIFGGGAAFSVGSISGGPGGHSQYGGGGGERLFWLGDVR